MKKIFIVLFLLFTFPFYACVKSVEETESHKPQIDLGVDVETEDNIEVDNIPSPETPEIFDEEEQEEKKKKTYLVSNANGLRVRSQPKSNSSVVGSLDKYDALILTEEVNGYYKTVYKEKDAYVHADYCEVLSVELGSEVVERAIEIGASLSGYPYVWGSQRYHWGNGILNKNFVKGEFDCSALVQYAYYKADKILLDVTSRKQSNNGVAVKRQDLMRGDLMFFTNASRKDKVGEERIGHVGIYFGNNYILHTASDHAVIEPISATRWSYYITARRVA